MTPDQYKSVLSDTHPRLKGTNNTMTMEELYQKGNHKCHHEEDWKEYKTFKDKVLIFIGAKEATNGALKETDNTLAGRLTRIENKVDSLMLAMLGGMGTAIIALVVAIISILR
jgi:hypothetical protein